MHKKSAGSQLFVIRPATWWPSHCPISLNEQQLEAHATTV